MTSDSHVMIDTPRGKKPANGWCVYKHPFHSAYDMYCDSPTAVAFDATCVVFDTEDDAQQFAASYEDAGNICRVYYHDSTDGGFVVCPE
jgi:hypothetical protein